MEKKIIMKEYWQELVEEYSIKLSENPTEYEVMEWMKKDKKQRDELIEKYGTSSWDIHRFMELVRAEKISESMFRQLVRYEMDKVFKKQIKL